MTALTWDNVGERSYETGVDRGVLYQLDVSGEYVDGVAWNGLTTVTESPSGAESNKQYADNLYLNLSLAEEFGGTIEAFTYPDEFGQCDGTAEPSPGVKLGQQQRQVSSGCPTGPRSATISMALTTATSCTWSTALSRLRRRRPTPRSTTRPRRFRSRGS
jgi:hypothetical protein